NAVTTAPDGLVVATPGLAGNPGALSGAVAFGSSSQLGGAEVNLLKNLFHTPEYSVDWLFGFRYLDLEETLTVYEASSVVAATTGQLEGNAGRFVSNRFVAIPEVGGQIGVQANCHLRLAVGYDFLYVNDVVRPGSQIDPVVTPRLVPSGGSFGTTSAQTAPHVT